MTELLINTDQEELITLATQTLAVQGKDSIAFLSQLLDDENYRLLACKALAQIPHRSVIEPLLSVVTDSEHQVRKIALMALRNFSEPKITQILIMALQDYNSDIRKEALIGLRLRLKANQAIPLIAIISPFLHDFHLSVAQEAAITLSHCRHSFAVNSLETVLNAKNTPLPLKETIIKSLGWIATSESIQCLGKFIHVSESGLIVKIIQILGRIKKSSLKPEIITILDRFYHSQNSFVREPEVLQALCYSWTQLKAVEAIPLLQKIQVSDNQQIHFHAESALKTLSQIYNQP